MYVLEYNKNLFFLNTLKLKAHSHCLQYCVDGVVWTYKGCYQDRFMDHDLNEDTLLTNTTGMTPAMCAKHCFSQGYSIMGLRVNTTVL